MCQTPFQPGYESFQKLHGGNADEADVHRAYLVAGCGCKKPMRGGWQPGVGTGILVGVGGTLLAQNLLQNRGRTKCYNNGKRIDCPGE